MRRLIFAVMIAASLGGCGRRARIVITRIEGVRPQQALVRCQTVGLDAPTFTWKLGASLREPTPGAPRDEASILVQWNEAAAAVGLTVTCRATDARGEVSVSSSLAELTIARASVSSGLVTVEGSGFGVPSIGDGVWLFAPHARVRADSSCPRASWSDTRIVACLPSGPSGIAPSKYQLRVESGGRLATAPAPLEVPR